MGSYLDSQTSTYKQLHRFQVPVVPRPADSDWESSINLSQVSVSSNPAEPLTVQLSAAGFVGVLYTYLLIMEEVAV